MGPASATSAAASSAGYPTPSASTDISTWSSSRPWLCSAISSSWLIPLVRSTDTPSGDAAARIDRLCEWTSLDVRDALCLDTNDAETAQVHLRGPPGYRRLFVTSTFLERFDETTARALLSIAVGRQRLRLLEIRAVTLVATAFPLLVAFLGDGPYWPLVGAAFVVLFVGLWYARRRFLSADEYAAERVGSETVAEALERYAEVHGTDPARRRFPNPLSMTVPLGDRIDRLRRRADADADAVDRR